MTTEDWTTAVLNLVSKPGYKPAKPRVLAKQLAISQDDLQDFKRLVKKLVKRGQLAYGSNHLVGLPGTKHDGAITGVFRRTQQGFGFVRPSNTPPSAGRDNDIYIAAENAGDAASGDVVLVRPLKAKPDGRNGGRGGRANNRRGVIVEVVERETHQFVGTYFEAGGVAWVRVDGTVFSEPVSVGDPGAKNAQPDDKVVFEMVRFPTPTHGGEGVVTEVLGARSTPGVDTLSIIREFNLPGEFASDTQEASREEAAKFDESIGHRTDITAETVITIDPVDARDFDDAISLERMENGHWRLGVHIADVSHFVRPGTALDREAHQRATSVYLPDRVIPMLPEIISNGLASLQPDKVRYTKTAFMEFTADGVRCDVELASTAIKSKRRFTYEEIDDYLEHPKKWQPKLTPEVHSLVARMHELAMILRGRRMRRGSLELSMREVKVDLDKNGRVVGAHCVENTVSHQIIEEFMLAANEAVADTLHAAELPFLRRIHQSPSPLKIKALTEFVTELGFDVAGLESRFELQKLLAKVADQPEQHAVNYAVLRSLQQAVYSPEEEGHYALASECYCHFTSPIRRYPDLTIHRLVEALLTKRKPRNDLTELAVLGEHCSDRERRAEQAERELTKVKLLHYLEDRIGQEMDAVVTGVEQFGLFAQGVELPAEGLIHITSLADDYYHYDKATHSLTGRRGGNAFRLGDRVRVVVVRVDIERRELDFRIVERGVRAPRVEKPSRRTSSHHGRGSDRPKRGEQKHGEHGARGKKPNKRGKKKRT